MTRLVPALSFGCAAAIGATILTMLGRGDAARTAVPTPSSAHQRATVDAGESLQRDLEQARRSYRGDALATVVQRLRERTTTMPKDADAWLALGRGLVEQALQRGHLLGMVPGRPTRSKLSPELERELDAADAALTRARELGVDSSLAWCLDAQIMSQRITGLGTALQWNGRIEAALAKAAERDADDPDLHIALGLRKLMAPAFFGQDPAAALEHFRYAAQAMPDDERPALFAAMASYVEQKRLDAIAWLERAAERNPDNRFVKVVLDRVRRGEDDPFGRDVEAAAAAPAAPDSGR